MFRVVFHPSSGAHNTVSTVSGIEEPSTATCRESGWMTTHPADQYASEMCIGLHAKNPLFLSYFSQTRIFSTNFRKILKYQIL